MLFINTILLAVVSALISAAPDNLERKANDLQVPSLNVPACPATGTVYYNTSLPSTDNTTFPKTQVDLCYEDAKIRITFTGWQEESFYCRVANKTPRFLCNTTVISDTDEAWYRQPERSSKRRYLRL